MRYRLEDALGALEELALQRAIERLSTLRDEQPGITVDEVLASWQAELPDQPSQPELESGTCSRCGRPVTRRDSFVTHTNPDGLAGNRGCRANSFAWSPTNDWDDSLNPRWYATWKTV